MVYLDGSGAVVTFSSGVNEKVTGTMYHTFTGFPPCAPGSQPDNEFTILNASASSKGCTPFKTTASSTLPFVLITNLTITLPSALSVFAPSGYLILFLRKSRSGAFPPGYSGICSTTTYVSSGVILSGNSNFKVTDVLKGSWTSGFFAGSQRGDSLTAFTTASPKN